MDYTTTIITHERFQRYIDGCLITWNRLVESNHQLLNSTIGLADEILEFHESLSMFSRSEKISEAGDVMYYATILIWLLSSDKSEAAGYLEDAYKTDTRFPYDREYFNEHDKFNFTLHSLQTILGSVKKGVYHGKQIDNNALIKAVQDILIWLNTTLIDNLFYLEEVMDYNFEKLSKRYPEGFAKLKSQ